VDPWLNTGVAADGAEVSSKRMLVGYTFLALQTYLDNYPARVEYSPRGLEARLAEPFGLPHEPEQLFERIEVDAQRLVTSLMSSEWKERFGKCRYRRCGIYFVRKKVRRAYKKGLFCCREHQMLASATVCTRNLRLAANRELIGFAAKHLCRWSVKDDLWQASSKQKHRLTEALCADLDRRPAVRKIRPPVRVNWVTRHQEIIEQARIAEMVSTR
jgi:hypothetical protein